MMKRFVRITIIFALALLLAGCREVPAAPAETTLPAQTTLPEETTVPVHTTVPVETTLPPETAVPTEPVPTTAPTEPVATESGSLPYLQFIQRADQSIFDGPSYDYALVGTVQQRGTYTIVEETWDYEGNLWGRLKSGAGWVDLTPKASSAPIMPTSTCCSMEPTTTVPTINRNTPYPSPSGPTAISGMWPSLPTISVTRDWCRERTSSPWRSGPRICPWWRNCPSPEI